MEVLVNALLYLAAICNASVFSALYLLLALFCSVWLMWNQKAPMCVYIILFLLSCSVLIFKVTIIVLYFADYHDSGFIADEDLLKMLGFLVTSKRDYQYDMFLTLFPDVLVLVISAIGWATTIRIGTASSVGKPWIWLFLNFGSICVNGVFSCTTLNLCYLLLSVVWSIVSTRRAPQSAYKFLCAFALALAILHLDFSFAFNIELYKVMDEKYRHILGALEFIRVNIVELGVVLATLYLSLFSIRSLLLGSADDLRQPLNPFELYRDKAKMEMSVVRTIPKREEQMKPEEKSDETSSQVISESPQSQRRSFLLIAWNALNSSQTLLLAFKVMIFFWVTHYQSWVGIAELCWLFYSILEPYRNRCIASLRLYMIPLLLSQTVVSYVMNIWSVDLDSYYGVQLYSWSWLEFTFQLVTIHLAFGCVLLNDLEQRTLFRGDSLTSNQCVMLVLENSDKISLCVLFAIGLSAINLLYAGLMVICMMFILNTKLAKKNWTGLVVYTMVLLMLRYIWVLAFKVDSVVTSSQLACEIIGLPYDKEQIKLMYIFLPQDYLVWILLVADSMQLAAYRSIHREGERHTKITPCFNAVLQVIATLYVRLKDSYIWMVYFLLFLVMLLSELNALNAIRFVLVLIFLTIHLKGKRKPIEDGFHQVKRVWFLFEYYSGALMSLRYLFQFTNFSHGFKGTDAEERLKQLGVRVYGTTDLYEAMIGDSILLITAVLTARSFRSQNRIERPQLPDGSDDGLLSDFIRKAKPFISERALSWIPYIAGPFDKVLSFVVCILAVYWKLSVSTLTLLALVMYYINLHTSYFYYRATTGKPITNSNINARYKMWLLLFMVVIICMGLDYCTFTLTFVDDSWNWYVSIAGFAYSTDPKLLDIWGYALVLILLIIEKHCIQYLRSLLDSDFEEKQGSTSLQLFICSRVIIEEVIIMCLFLVAFTKLTVVSIIYVTAVLLFIRKKRHLTRIRCLTFTLVVMILAQYIVILSNAHQESTPQDLPSPKPSVIPWYLEFEGLGSAWREFLNLGTSLSQLHSLSSDLLVLFLCWVYFQYLSNKETPNSPMHDPDARIHFAWFEIMKTFLYNFSHILILLLVLVFVSQSAGLTAVVYCVFCLAFLWKGNELLKGENEWARYIRLLRVYFISFMLIDFFLNILYQIPYKYLHDNNSNSWTQALGLIMLWQGEDSTPPEDARQQYMWIVYKILTFTLIQLIIRMFENKDFLEFMEQFRSKASSTATEVGIEMAQQFNNDRIRKTEKYRVEKQTIEQKLHKLDVQVKKWHNSQKLVLESNPSLVEDPASLNLSDEPIISPQETIVEKPPFKLRILFRLTKLMNPFLFKNFLDSLQQCEFRMSWRSRTMLILAILMSNTQAICYLIFIVNNLVYASLESIVFPVSVLWCDLDSYAMLEDPRPVPKYWRVMLAYAETVFFIKFLLHLDIWDQLGTSNPFDGFYDPNKIGFLEAQYTYTPTIFAYTVLDVLCILAVLAHEYYLIRCGLNVRSEYEIESLSSAKLRLEGAGPDPFQVDDASDHEHRKIKDSFKRFLTRLMPTVKEEKPGKDLYTLTILIQLLILLYIVFFYTKMDGEYQDISTSFNTNQFSGNMVVALLIQTTLIILDRYLYLVATSQSIQKAEETVPRRKNTISWKSYFALKCWFYMILVCFIHAMVFWYYPITGNELKQYPTGYSSANMHNSDLCNNFQVNPALICFYLLYLLYFFVTAIQVRLGMPSFRAGSMPLTHYGNNASRYTFQVYMGMPFLFELRTMIDWAFTKTSLDLFQWFKFEDIYSQLYITKVLMKGYYNKPRGEPIGFCEKFFMGFCGLLITLLIILAPLIIFSSLNPIVNDNPIKSASVGIGVTINGSYYELYSAGRVQSIGSVSSSAWDEFKLYNVRDISPNERNMLQLIVMPDSSDTLWDITEESRGELVQGLNSVSNVTSGTTSSLAMKYTFTRDYLERKLTLDKCDELLDVLNNTNSIQSFFFPDFYSYIIRIPTTGALLNPQVLENGNPNYTTGLNLTLKQGPPNFSYWTIPDISFLTISEQYSPITFNFSVLTFYVSVVYVAGRLLRIMTGGSAANLLLTDMPHPGPLIDLCEGVYIARMSGDLKKEERLYFELIDILRSPEVVKLVTGRSALKEE